MDRNFLENDPRGQRVNYRSDPHLCAPNPADKVFSSPTRTNLAKKADLGQLRETRGMASCNWTIPDFLSLPEGADVCCWSPFFPLSDSCWQMQVFPDGEKDMKSEGWVSLYLWKCDSGPPKTMSFTLGIRNADGMEEVYREVEGYRFTGKGDWYCQFYFINRGELLRRRMEIFPSGDLTVTCTLRSNEQLSTEVSLFKRLWSLGKSWRRVLDEEGNSNVMLKLNGRETLVHSLVLQSRSTFFGCALSKDMRRGKSRVIELKHDNADAMEVALNYMYTGDPKGLEGENACAVYGTAHKYGLQELKELCCLIIEKNLSMESICDVIEMSDFYGETEIKKRAKEYFSNNVNEIVKSENWKALKLKNPVTVSELLESALLEKASGEGGEDLAHPDKRMRFR